jgi:hypothetical protein
MRISCYVICNFKITDGGPLEEKRPMTVKHDLWNLKGAGIFTARKVIVATNLDGAVLQVHSSVSCDPVLATPVTHQTYRVHTKVFVRRYPFSFTDTP